MNKVIDKGFRSSRFVSTIVKHPVHANKENFFMLNHLKKGQLPGTWMKVPTWQHC